jgi:hypothetical protein
VEQPRSLADKTAAEVRMNAIRKTGKVSMQRMAR